MEEVAKETLPSGYGFAWSGMAYEEEKKSGGTSANAFIFGIIIVFLVLAAQFESWILPGSVLTAVPFGILGALVFNWMRGLDNDVYFQIGLLVLIGLGAKNAVLRVSFAVDLRKQGLSVMEATKQAGEERLRPIIMTSLAFIFGVMPLALAMGAGANARHSIGTGIIGGMIGETTLAMLYVPLFFYLFETLAERSKAKKKAVSPAAGKARGRALAGKPRRPDPAQHPKGADRHMRRTAFITALVAVCTIGLAGYMVGPDYVRPTVDMPEAFRFDGGGAPGASDAVWWAQFGDPVLDALVAESLANNRNVKIAAANIGQAAVF